MNSTSDFDRNSLSQGWFGSLSGEIQREILSFARPIELLDGEQLYNIGAVSSGMFGIVSGSLRLMVATHKQELRFGHLLGPGGWAGEHALILNTERLVDMAAAGATRVLYVSARDFHAIANKYQTIWHSMAQLSTVHLRQAFCIAEDLMLRSPEQRVAATLLRLGQRRGAHPAIRPLERLHVSQQDVATAANVSLSTGGRLLRRFEAEEMIDCRYGVIEIHRPDDLEQLVRDAE